eukprot:855264-Prorocentrum_minimum.AAC.1
MKTPDGSNNGSRGSILLAPPARDTLVKNHPYAVGETMRGTELGTWVRSTRGQFTSTRGSRCGHRNAPLSRLGRRGALYST